MLGGTRFIGRALVEELIAAGHQVLVVHRGRSEPDGIAQTPHLHVDRRALRTVAGELDAFASEGVIDLCAMTGADAEVALDALPGGIRLVVVSSIDVYRAFTAVWEGTITDAVPLAESSALREQPPPDRAHRPDDWDYDPAQYEKLDVERAYLDHGATVCRLPMVYGPHDYKRREEFVLRRVRADRRQIPVGRGAWLWSRGHVAEVARGLRLALEADVGADVFNLAESSCAPIRLWMEQILAAAGATSELVQVGDDVLPGDLDLTGDAVAQHWLVDSSRARERLGWVHADPAACVADSVAWHLANAPVGEGTDFETDDRALAAG